MRYSHSVERAVSVLTAAASRGLFERWRPGALLSGEAPERRYGNVPPEAFPVLHSGRDGAHYALWIDDPSDEAIPPVVLVSPMDRRTLLPIAESAERFLALVEAEGSPWLESWTPPRRAPPRFADA